MNVRFGRVCEVEVNGRHASFTEAHDNTVRRAGYGQHLLNFSEVLGEILGVFTDVHMVGA